MRHVLCLTLIAALVAPITAQAQPDPVTALERADTNGDGVIERSEFVAMRGAMFDRLDRKKKGQIALSAAPRAMQKRGEQLRMVLVAADADHNGVVTRQEFMSAPTPGFDRADTDGDGRVTAKELQALKAR